MEREADPSVWSPPCNRAPDDAPKCLCPPASPQEDDRHRPTRSYSIQSRSGLRYVERMEYRIQINETSELELTLDNDGQFAEQVSRVLMPLDLEQEWQDAFAELVDVIRSRVIDEISDSTSEGAQVADLETERLLFDTDVVSTTLHHGHVNFSASGHVDGSYSTSISDNSEVDGSFQDTQFNATINGRFIVNLEWDVKGGTTTYALDTSLVELEKE